MKCEIKIHPLVKEDIKSVTKSQKEKIKKVIKSKLGRAPGKFGRQLRGEFKKYRRLKVGDYRVVYRVHKRKVLVLVIKIGIRRDFKIYKDLAKRLKKL